MSKATGKIKESLQKQFLCYMYTVDIALLGSTLRNICYVMHSNYSKLHCCNFIRKRECKDNRKGREKERVSLKIQQGF